MDLKGKLVFASGRALDFDIWSLDLASQTLRQLTHGRELNDMPCWSPNGWQIAYISVGSDSISSLWIMDQDGRNKQRLTSTIHCQYPSWSPGGKSILFSGSSKETAGTYEIMRYDLSSGNSEVLFQRPGTESHPCLSPDGKRIAFTAADPNSSAPASHRDTEIWERDLETGAERRICSHPAIDCCPAYSPDGTKLAFVSHRNGESEASYQHKVNQIYSAIDPKDTKSVQTALAHLKALEKDGDIYVVDLTSGNLTALTKNNQADSSVRWSPCGDYLVYTTAPLAKHNSERIRIIESGSGKPTQFKYDRCALEAEIDADIDSLVNDRLFKYLIPDFIERPLTRHALGSTLWGEERWPDWSYS